MQPFYTALTHHDQFDSAIRKYATKLSLPLNALEADFFIAYYKGQLSIRDSEMGYFSVDFLTDHWQKRQKQLNTELLKKALNLKKYPHPSVLDMTAGWGQDAFICARLGCEVHMIERSPIVAALLADGLSRLHAVMPEIEMTLQVGEAREILPTLSAPDIIYIDPMFPTHPKTARSQKSMQYLQKIAGQDAKDDLLSLALKHARMRVVVKRPRLAPCLSTQKPDFQLQGRSVRFDVYTR